MKFEKAVRKKARLRLALTGPSGSGKTLGALMIAKGIGGKIALIDTEKGSASLYASPVKMPDGRVFDPPEFDVLELSAPYSPERYSEAIGAAQSAGYDTLIVDSTTHEWSGVGGCLEILEDVARSKFRGNTWSAWNEVTPRHRAFIDSMLQTTMHVIATGRSKTETAQSEEGGKKKVLKLGMKVEQRDGFEYEFTTVLDIVHDGHYAVASKDRTGLFTGDPKRIDESTGRDFLAWLERGAEPVRQVAAGMPESQVLDWIASVQSMTTGADILETRDKAKAACVAVGDTAAYERIVDAAKKRAAKLSPKKAGPEVGDGDNTTY
jgi:hypothetical protein